MTRCEHPSPAAYLTYRWLLTTRIPEWRRLVMEAEGPLTASDARLTQLRSQVAGAESTAATTGAAADEANSRARAESAGNTSALPVALAEIVAASRVTAEATAEKATADAESAATTLVALRAELETAEREHDAIVAATITGDDLLAAMDEIGARTYDAGNDNTNVELINNPSPAQTLARWYIAGGPTRN